MGGMGFIENNKALCMLSSLINTHLLMAAKETGVKRFLFSSSACVYASWHQDHTSIAPLKESDAYPADPEDGYGWEKLFSERMCRHFYEDFGLETRVARYHNVYGPWGSYDGGREKAPAAACRKIANVALGSPNNIEMWGDGKQVRSFTYIDDCVEGIQKIMHSKIYEPINLGSSELVSINQLVDIAEAIAGTAAGIFGNQGEVCSAGSRVFVHASVYDEVLEGMVAEAGAIRLGSGLDEATTMGPLVSAVQRDRVRSYVDGAPGDGARHVFTGALPESPELAGGFFVAPSVFEVPDHSPAIAREEIFGPVATVFRFEDVDEVVRQANNTEYGLAAAIWTRDINLALTTARRVRAGVVWVNDSQPAPSESLWGGYKQSGVGRELGRYALDAYLETKQIYINLGS